MDSLAGVVVFIIAVVLVSAGIVGYGCRGGNSINTAKMADEAPCAPVLSNGDKNPHYQNAWNACRSQCGGYGSSRGMDLNLKTCECKCGN